MLVVLLVCSAALALLFAGSARAYSRGFVIRNDSDTTLTFVEVRRLRQGMSASFEGLPPLGSALAPGTSQRFELKYSPFAAYGAALGYEYPGQWGRAMTYIMIENAEYTKAACGLIPPSLRCTASGLDITIRNL